MQLKEFIKTCLTDITNAVEEAKELTQISIAPARLFQDDKEIKKEYDLIEENKKQNIDSTNGKNLYDYNNVVKPNY